MPDLLYTGVKGDYSLAVTNASGKTLEEMMALCSHESVLSIKTVIMIAEQLVSVSS